MNEFVKPVRKWDWLCRQAPSQADPSRNHFLNYLRFECLKKVTKEKTNLAWASGNVNRYSSFNFGNRICFKRVYVEQKNKV